MSALFCLFLSFRSYPEKVEEYIPIFYKIRYILEELYLAVMWIISQLIIYIDQMNTAFMFCPDKSEYPFFMQSYCIASINDLTSFDRSYDCWHFDLVVINISTNHKTATQSKLQSSSFKSAGLWYHSVIFATSSAQFEIIKYKSG